MKNTYQVLILSDQSKKILPELEQMFEAESSMVIKFITSDLVNVSDLKDSDFIILDYSLYLKNSDEIKIVFLYLDKLSVVAEINNSDQMTEIIKNTGTSHLFGMSGASFFKDIKSYLMACIRNEFISHEKFILHSNVKSSHTLFCTSENLDQQIAMVLEQHDLSDTFQDFKKILIHIINEAVTNALFNAPVDSGGNFLYRDHHRREVVTSAQEMCPTLDIIDDEDTIILSVKDFYGTLTKEKIDRFITNTQVVEKKGGAGVGISLILKHAHKLIINIEPGKMTEFVIVLHKFRRFLHYQSLEKSYHLYQRKLP